MTVYELMQQNKEFAIKLIADYKRCSEWYDGLICKSCEDRNGGCPCENFDCKYNTGDEFCDDVISIEMIFDMDVNKLKKQIKIFSELEE